MQHVRDIPWGVENDNFGLSVLMRVNRSRFAQGNGTAHAKASHFYKQKAPLRRTPMLSTSAKVLRRREELRWSRVPSN